MFCLINEVTVLEGELCCSSLVPLIKGFNQNNKHKHVVTNTKENHALKRVTITSKGSKHDIMIVFRRHRIYHMCEDPLEKRRVVWSCEWWQNDVDKHTPDQRCCSAGWCKPYSWRLRWISCFLFFCRCHRTLSYGGLI